MKTMKTISSLNVIESVELSSLLRQIAKKFYLGKTSVLHMTSESFISDIWSDRTRIEYHGLSIVLESWFWNGQDYFDLTLYYKGIEINPFQWEGLVQYAKVILWYLSEDDFRSRYSCSLFKEEIAQILELKDDIRKIEKQHERVHQKLMETLTKSR